MDHLVVTADVCVYVAPATARVETGGAPWRVDAPVGGRVTLQAAAVGARVMAGQPLLELDATAEDHRLAEQRATLYELPVQITRLREQIAARLARAVAEAEEMPSSGSRRSGGSARSSPP